MAVYVPSQYQQYVTEASSATDLPEAVVAAQINYESSWDPNAVSSAGAQGIAQFEPGTFAQYGPRGGSPFKVSDAFQAYSAYMDYLLSLEGDNIRKALAAYNAGPGNLSAGYGYADHILSTAGVASDATTKGSKASGQPQGTSGVTNTGGTSTASAGGSDVGSAIKQAAAPIAATFGDFSSALTSAMHGVLWLVNPSNWLRMIAGVIGGVLVVAGAVLVAGSA